MLFNEDYAPFHQMEPQFFFLRSFPLRIAPHDLSIRLNEAIMGELDCTLKTTLTELRTT